MATVNSLFLVQLMIYYFIDFVDGRNALVKLYKNDTNTTFNDKRRVLRECSNGIDIPDFSANELLLGVALISRWDFTNNKWESHCTGSLVKNERKSDHKHYVLTASHCFYSTKESQHHWVGRTYDLSYWRVEFGVTKEWKWNENKNLNTHSIIKCDVKDIRVNDEFVNGQQHPRNDYAIMTLGGNNCKPRHPFKLRKFKKSDKNKLHRAGYRKTRTLKVVKHEQISHAKSSFKRHGDHTGLVITKGCQDMGDSGGPHYIQETGKLYQTAIVGGTWALPGVNREYYGVEINPDVKTKIFDLMDGYYGISRLVKTCDTSNTCECWSIKCESEPPKLCFKNQNVKKGSMIRNFHENNKKLKCEKNNKFHYLCGRVEILKPCLQSIPGVHCLTGCGAKKCPKGRSSLHGMYGGCSSGKSKHICSPKSA